MHLRHLQFADIFRDGGSYEAFFSTDEPLGFCVCLLCLIEPVSEGSHHKYLYAFRSEAAVWLQIPEGVYPIVTGSEEERQLLQMLEPFVDETADESAMKRLAKMMGYIRKREPCLPNDPIFRSQPKA